MQDQLKTFIRNITFVFLTICFTINISKAQIVIDPTDRGGENIKSSDTTGFWKRDTTKAEVKIAKFKLYPKSQFANHLWLLRDSLTPIDTTISDFHRYFPASNQLLPYANLGTIGSPEKILAIMPFSSTGINIGFQQFALQNKTPDKLQFHEVSQPFTVCKYVQGTGGLIGLNILHTQNFSKTWNVVLDYNSILNGDMYTPEIAQQQNLNRSTLLGSNFTSQNKKYQQQIILSWNRNRRVENGGLISDSLFYGPNFQKSNAIKQRLFGNYFPQITSAKSFWAQNDHRFKHRYFFDTNQTVGIAQTIRFHKVRFQYQDKTTDTNFYGTNYNFNAKKIVDSTAYSLIDHRIGVNFQKQFSNFNANLQINHIFQSLNYQYDTNRVTLKEYNIQSQGFEGILNTKYKSWEIFAEANFFVLGYAQKAFLINSELKKSFNKKYFISLRGQISNQPISQYLSTFTSNYFYFSTNKLNYSLTSPNFTQQQFASIKISKVGDKLSGNLMCNIGSLQNDYLGINDAIPSKIDLINFIQFGADISLKIGKFIFQQQAFIQLNQNSILKNYGFPKLNARSAIYFQNVAFKEALLFRLGIEGIYTSSYNQLNYRPDAASYYFNLNNTHPLGNYPVFDVFASGRIQNVDLFIKWEHINQWYVVPGFNSRFEQAYQYPIEPERIRFGFNWRFWN